MRNKQDITVFPKSEWNMIFTTASRRPAVVKILPLATPNFIPDNPYIKNFASLKPISQENIPA
jgi:hypothetical protein